MVFPDPVPCWDSCDIHPSGLSERGKGRARCLQQLQVIGERRHCWYPRLLKCFQSLSCARRHRIYSVPVFSFLLKLTRNPPTNCARVKLNKLTFLFTFSKGALSAAVLISFLFLHQTSRVLCDGGWMLPPLCQGHLPVTYFTLLLPSRISHSADCLSNQRVSSITYETCATFSCFLKERAKGTKRRGKS